MFVKKENRKVLANIYLTFIINKAIKIQNLINRTLSNAINTQIATNIQIIIDTQVVVNI